MTELDPLVLQIQIDLLKLAGMITVVVVAVIAGVIKSFKGGYLGRVMDKYVYSKDNGVEDRLTQIQECVEDTYAATRSNGDQIQDLAEAVVLLHRDDPNVDTNELRKKVEVDELPNDIIERKPPGFRRDGESEEGE